MEITFKYDAEKTFNENKIIFEKKIIYEALKSHKGSRTATAKTLGLQRSSLLNKLNMLNIVFKTKGKPGRPKNVIINSDQ